MNANRYGKPAAANQLTHYFFSKIRENLIILPIGSVTITEERSILTLFFHSSYSEHVIITLLECQNSQHKTQVQ